MRGSSSRCEPHSREREQSRGTSTERGYDGAWRKLRNAFLEQHPHCEHVDQPTQERCTLPATDVDHVIAHRGNDALRLDWNNLQALCHAHHSSKTARHDGGFGRART